MNPSFTKEQAQAFIRKVMGTPRKTLEGKAREQILLLLAMLEPFETSNNQHSFTECYMIGTTEYHITSFPDGDVIVDEMLAE